MKSQNQKILEAYKAECLRTAPQMPIIEFYAHVDILSKALENSGEDKTMKEKLSPPPADRPEPAPEEENAELTTMEFSVVATVCKLADVGIEVINPQMIAERMETDVKPLYSVIESLCKKRYISKERINARRFNLHPQKRQNGERYSLPKKQNGVTKCPTGFAHGYGYKGTDGALDLNS